MQVDSLNFQDFYRAEKDGVRRILYRITLANPMLIDELCQDVFLKAWSHRHEYPAILSLRAWIKTIAVRTAIDSCRRQKKRLCDDFDINLIADRDAKPLDRMMVQRGLSSLDTIHRAVLILFELEDWTIDECAEHLGIPPGTVKSRLHHARKKLRESIQGGLDHADQAR